MSTRSTPSASGLSSRHVRSMSRTADQCTGVVRSRQVASCLKYDPQLSKLKATSLWSRSACSRRFIASDSRSRASAPTTSEEPLVAHACSHIRSMVSDSRSDHTLPPSDSSAAFITTCTGLYVCTHIQAEQRTALHIAGVVTPRLLTTVAPSSMPVSVNRVTSCCRAIYHHDAVMLQRLQTSRVAYRPPTPAFTCPCCYPHLLQDEAREALRRHATQGSRRGAQHLQTRQPPCCQRHMPGPSCASLPPTRRVASTSSTRTRVACLPNAGQN